MRAQVAVARAYLSTRLRCFATRAELSAYQERALTEQIKWLNEHIPYYRDLSLATWETSPVMNRANFTANFAQLNSLGLTHAEALELALKAEQGILEGDISAGLSSGTSGGALRERGIFLTSPRERWQWAGVILAKALPQVWRQPQRVALFLRSNSALYSSVRSTLVKFEYFDLATPVAEQVSRLNTFEPTVIVAPPSRLRLLVETEALKVMPATLFAGAETLEPLDQRIIEAAFNQQLRQIYQATEGFLGISCAHGNLHLNEDSFILQKDYLDEASGRFAPIITDFQRKTQAVVRYRLDDLLREVTCACGSVLQAVRVEGREQDIFRFRSQTGEAVALYPDELRDVFALAAIREFQVSQMGANTLRIRLEPHTPDLIRALRLRVAALFKSRQLPQPELSFSLYTRPSGSHKLRRVTNATTDTASP